LNHFDDKTGKPVAIQLAIGKHPVLICGNEGGKVTLLCQNSVRQENILPFS